MTIDVRVPATVPGGEHFCSWSPNSLLWFRSRCSYRSLPNTHFFGTCFLTSLGQGAGFNKALFSCLVL